MSQLNVDTIKNRLGTAGPTVPSLSITNDAIVGGALTVTGNIVGVAATFTGNVSIAGTLTSSFGTLGSNGTGTRTVQSGGSPSGGSDGDIYYIY